MRTFRRIILLPLFLFALGLFAQHAHAQGVGFIGSGYDVSAPTDLVAADFNGDGKLDLATASCETQDLSIVLGNGDGTFGAVTSFAIGPCDLSFLVGIVAGDFNGDSKLDLATANGHTVSILLGNGDGTFGAHADFITGTAAERIAVGDFNGDGKLDLVTANPQGNNISILLGQGGGVFATHVDFPTGIKPTMVVVGDFNGDGKEDIGVPAVQSDAVSILLGNGDGTFGPRTDFSTGRGPASLAKGDFNGDGILDLVTANILADSASILLGKGDGTFGPRTDLETFMHLTSGDLDQVTVADFNADGNLDFLTASVVSFSIANAALALRLGNGDGTFGSNFRVGTLAFPAGIAAGDFNADGRIDLAIPDPVDDGVSIFLQGPALTLDLASLFFGVQLPGTTSSPQTITAHSTGSFPLNISSVALAGADLDQFSITADACSGTPIPSGSGCTITLVFSPTTSGVKSASLVVTHNASGSPHSVILTGNVTTSPLTVTRAGTGSGTVTSSPAKIDCGATCSASFPSGTVVSLTATPASGSTLDGWSGACSGTASCSVTMDAAKNVTATFDTVPPFDFGASPSPKAITAGQSAQFMIEVLGQPGFSAAVSFSCSSGVPQGAVCSFNPTSVSPGASAATTTLTVTTTSRFSAAAGQSSAIVFAWLLLPLALIVGPRSRRSRRWTWLSKIGILLVVIGTMVACGGGSIPTNNPNGTPAGTYTIMITGTSGSISRSQNVTLVVN